MATMHKLERAVLLLLGERRHGGYNAFVYETEAQLLAVIAELKLEDHEFEVIYARVPVEENHDNDSL